MQTSGWVCSFRKIWESPLFEGNALRVGVWQWMVQMAVWKPTPFRVGGQVIQLERGQFCASQAQICEKTGMTRKQLRNFLEELEAQNAVVTKRALGGAKGRTIITICNYDKYQDVAGVEGQEGGQRRAKEGPTKEQDNKYPNGTGKPVDPVKIMFDSGIELLTGAGKSVGNARSILGKWRKAHGTSAVIEALGKAQREGAIDPVSFIEGTFKYKAKSGGASSINEKIARLGRSG